MKFLFTIFILFSSCLANASSIDPIENEVARELLLNRTAIQEGLKWVSEQNIDGSTINPDYDFVTRAKAFPEGAENLDPEVHFYQEQHLMFLSWDWRFICQVLIKVMWRADDTGISIIEEFTDQESYKVCFPRI